MKTKVRDLKDVPVVEETATGSTGSLTAGTVTTKKRVVVQEMDYQHRHNLVWEFGEGLSATLNMNTRFLTWRRGKTAIAVDNCRGMKCREIYRFVYKRYAGESKKQLKTKRL